MHDDHDFEAGQLDVPGHSDFDPLDPATGNCFGLMK